MRRPYTMPELKAVRAAVLAGSTVKAEAEALGRDHQCLSQALRRSLGFVARSAHQERQRDLRDKARASVARGSTHRAAAQALGISETNVQRSVHTQEQLKAPPVLPAWLPRCSPRVLAQLDTQQPNTRPAIAKALGLSLRHVGRVLVMLESAGLASGDHKRGPGGIGLPKAWTLTVAGHQALAKLGAS